MTGKVGSGMADLSNQRFGRLVCVDAESRVVPSGRRQVYWNCICDCGNKTAVRSQPLKEGRIVSCGCWAKEKPSPAKTHGMSGSDEYKIYKDILRRCLNPKNQAYSNYGGRGIKCEWETFEQFYADIGPRPSPVHTIERADVDGNYCKGNCRWVDDWSLQAFNQRTRVSKTGIPGVRPDGQGYGFVVSIGKDYVKHYLGFFKTLKEAAEVRKQAELDFYGFNLKWEMPDE